MWVSFGFILFFLDINKRGVWVKEGSLSAFIALRICCLRYPGGSCGVEALDVG